jgi:hypothetical protein
MYSSYKYESFYNFFKFNGTIYTYWDFYIYRVDYRDLIVLSISIARHKTFNLNTFNWNLVKMNSTFFSAIQRESC